MPSPPINAIVAPIIGIGSEPNADVNILNPSPITIKDTPTNNIAIAPFLINDSATPIAVNPTANSPITNSAPRPFAASSPVMLPIILPKNRSERPKTTMDKETQRSDFAPSSIGLPNIPINANARPMAITVPTAANTVVKLGIIKLNSAKETPRAKIDRPANRSPLPVFSILSTTPNSSNT